MGIVSVIIPCYKYAHFLRNCVRSVLDQSVDVRILIIDDASPDNTAEVAMELAAQDSRVEVKRHRTNLGHIATYNEGLLEWAMGDYSVLLSADDLLAPGSLLRATQVLDAHPEVGFVYGRAIKFHNEAPATVRHSEAPYQVQPGILWLEGRCADGGNCIYSPEVMVRTATQKRVGGYRKDLPHSGDLEMWMRFAVTSDVGVLDDEQAYYRIHSQNMHVQQFSAHLVDLKERKAAFDALFRECGERINRRVQLEELANQSLAREAVWAVCEAFDHDEAANFPAGAFLNFALDTYPNVKMLREYRSVRLRMQMGGRLWTAVRCFSKRHRSAVTA